MNYSGINGQFGSQLDRAYSAFLLIVGLIISFGSTALYATQGTQVVLDAAVLGLLILLFFNAHFLSALVIGKNLAPCMRSLFICGFTSFSIMALLGAAILPMAAKQPAIDLMFRSIYVAMLISEVGFWGGKILFFKLEANQRG